VTAVTVAAAIAGAVRQMVRLRGDCRGHVTTNLLTQGLTFCLVGGVFLSNSQLSRSYVQRDAVDHAAAVAADTAMKTYCDSRSDRQGAPRTSVMPLLEAAGARSCEVNAAPVGITPSAGRMLDVSVDCSFPCPIVYAATSMCHRGALHFVQHKKTVAMGCDGL
jgi:hypothetical protein